MADLPNIDTSQVSFIAFWNAIDDGNVASIDPEEALSEPNIQTYTLYDNGFEANYQFAHGRSGTVRIKSDGWIIAYIDRTENFDTNTGIDNIRGPWDIMWNWTNLGSTVSSLDNNTLEMAIDSLRQELSNSDNMDYAQTDVGLYNYMEPDATEYVVYSDASNGNSNGYADDYLITHFRGLLHSQKSIYKCYFIGGLSGSDGYGNPPHGHAVIFEPNGVNVTLASGGGRGSADITGDVSAGAAEYEAYHAHGRTDLGSSSASMHLLFAASDA